ncbi:MAG: hypothetical protein D6822_07005 [Cyanobacteria bacterium J149]|nr:MAG: hypothetical protein D6822_07005 [Cyanobacteria bacterium J149]
MDENNQNTGVESQPESETGAVSPNSEQTTQGQELEQASGSNESNEVKTVPYERFKEVNEKYRQTEEKIKELEAKLEQAFSQPASQEPVDPNEAVVKETLKKYGFVSQEDVQAEINRLREDQALEQTLSQLEKTYNGKDGRPKFDRQKVVEYAVNNAIPDPELAYKALYEKELLNWHIEQASKKQTGVKAESSDGSGSKPIGASNDELMQKAMSGDESAMDTLLSRTNVFQKFFGK